MSISRNIELRPDAGTIVLRPPQLDDASAFYEAVQLSMDDLQPWMYWCTPDYALEDTLEWLKSLPAEWEAGQTYAFAIVDAVSGQILGSCGIAEIIQRHQFANLGYWVRSDRTGEGIASEAAQTLAQFGFRELGLQRIEIVIGVENKASRRVAEKAGAQYEAILRKRIKLGERNVDAAMYAFTAGDLR